MIDFDGTRLYPSPMWDKNSVYHKIESGFAFNAHMNDVYEAAFKIQTFHQDGNESVFFKKILQSTKSYISTFTS